MRTLEIQNNISPLLERLIVSILLAIYLTLSLTSSLKDAPVFDEPLHLTRSFYYYKHQEKEEPPLMETSNMRPPLTYIVSGFPLKYSDLQGEPLTQKESVFEWEDFSVKFFYKNFYGNLEKLTDVLFVARASIAIWGLLLGLTIYRWAKTCHGIYGGLFSLLLFAFSPNILAHSHYVTTDFLATVFIFMSSYTWWRCLKQSNIRNIFLAGITLGLALISKYTAVILILSNLIIAIIYILHRGEGSDFKKRFSTYSKLYCTVFLISLFPIWAAYSFDIGNISGLELTFKNTPLEILSKIPFLAPHYWQGVFNLTGLLNVGSEITGRPYYLLGEISGHTRWYYYPLSFLIKTPVPLLLALIFSLLSYLKCKEYLKSALPLLVPPTLLILAIMLNNLQIGMRHLLPLFPFIFVISSRFLIVTVKHDIYKKLLFIFLSGWLIVSSLSIFPHYLAHFNILVGGPQHGYKYLVDSNLDWGQDVLRLKEYTEEKGIKPKLLYFGLLGPEFYQIDHEKIRGCQPAKGPIAVSATILVGTYIKPSECFNWLLQREPIKQIGYSIFMYE